MTGPVIHVFAFDREGRAVRAPSPEEAHAEAFLWIHIDVNDDAAQVCLTERLKLEHWAAETLLAADTRPRCEMFGSAAAVNLRGINHNPGDVPEDMVSVRMWITTDRIVTARLRRLTAIGDVRAAVEEGRARPQTPGALVALIALRLADNMTPTITELNDNIDDFEEQVLDDPADIPRIKLAQLRRTAILIRRFVAPQREALNKLALEVFPWSREEDRRRIREAADMTTRIAEELDAARERAAIVQDQITDARAVSLNRSMLVLSIAAVVFLPLNLLAGMFGMNVGGVPFGQSVWGFWVIGVVMSVLGVVGVWLFVRLGWLDWGDGG